MSGDPEDARGARPFARAMSYFPRVRGRWIRGMLCILPASGLEFAVPLIVTTAVDGIADGSLEHGDVVTLALLALVAVVVKGAAKFFMRYWVTGASREFERIYRQDLFRHLMRLTPHDLGGVRTGDVMSRSVADVEAVRMLLGPGVMYVSQAAVVVPVALVLMFRLDPVLSSAMIVTFVGIAAVIKVAARPTQHWSEATQERLAELSTVAHENVSGIRVVKAFATEAVSGSVFRAMGRDLLEANLRLATLRGMTSAGITAFKDLGALLILGLGGWHVVQGTLTTGELFFFLMVLGLALWPLIAIGWMLGMYHRARAGAVRLEELFALRPSVVDGEGAAGADGGDRTLGDLAVRDLRWAWNGTPVLHGIDLTVPAGTTLGITGRTGCGKTTLVQLVSRLVDPPPGTVFLGDTDVRDLPLATLRQTLGLVPQDTFLFSETIEQNIAFAGAHVSPEAVRAAARTARVDADIEGFPEGYDERLGERGVTLSGGQRQRTAIARTLAARPPVILLDDCLSAVDSVTEQEILAGLRDELAGRTAVVVSHRVAALALADRVVVMDDGRIVEEGTHDELLEQGGLYAELHERQRLEQEIEAL